MSPRWHQLPQEPFLARFIPETKTNVAPFCGQMRIFVRNARPRPPASDYKCGGKSNIVAQVPSRARETLTFEALQNSKRGNCHLASTKHLLLIMPEFPFAKFRGINNFQICDINVTNLVSQLSGSSHLAGGCILGCPMAGQIPKSMPAARKARTHKSQNALHRRRIETVS